MAITIGKTKKSDSLKDVVEQICGADISVCVQCRKCSSGCPVGKQTSAGPAEIMRRLHLDAGNELLESDIIWTCVSCETCSARCPNGIEVAAIIDALRKLALERKASKQKGNVPLFNKAFLKTVQFLGRTYEIAMIAAYKLGTGKFMDDTEKFPKMLLKGKISVVPSLGGDRKLVRRIFKKTKQKREAKE